MEEDIAFLSFFYRNMTSFSQLVRHVIRQASLRLREQHPVLWEEFKANKSNIIPFRNGNTPEDAA